MDSDEAQLALKVLNSLPESVQDRAQEVLMRSLSNPYHVANLSIPLALGLAYVPHFVKATLAVINKGPKYNNETPRSENYLTYSSFGGAMERARAAHINALEMFPAFAAGVLLARMNKVKPAVLTGLCVKYLGLRVVYTLLYIFGINQVIAAGRTFSWVAMVNVVMNIYKESL